MPTSEQITFEAKAINGTWVVAAYCPGHKRPTLLKGFKTKDDALNWIDGPRSAEWKRVWGTLHD